MKHTLHFLPTVAIAAVAALMLLHGPTLQPAKYHEFADHSLWASIPHAADVLSNLGFAVVALWGAVRLWPRRNHAAVRAGWVGYRMFLIALLLTSIGSTYYHLAPDDWRLVWDRLPIALACAGLLAGVRAKLVPRVNVPLEIVPLTAFAVVSVVWWYVGQQTGGGDLRPCLMLQIAPLVLIPIWQAVHGASRADRLWFGFALLLYVLAKIAEVHDHEMHSTLGWITGHTIKHLLASAAAWVLVARLIRSTSSALKPADAGNASSSANHGKPTAGCAPMRLAALMKSLSNDANLSLCCESARCSASAMPTPC